jgi:hypothetical protein
MVAVGVSVDAADNERLLVLRPVPAVLSIREGGPVGKGGHNSDEALVASSFERDATLLSWPAEPP